MSIPKKLTGRSDFYKSEEHAGSEEIQLGRIDIIEKIQPLMRDSESF